MASAVLKEGYLKKQSPSGLAKLKPWQKRWFVLEGFDLLYYEDSKATEPLGLIPLEIASSIKIIKKGGSFCIELVVSFYIEKKEGERTYNLQAESLEDAEDWVELLRDQRKRTREHQNRRQTILVDREVDPSGEEHGNGTAHVDVDPEAEYDEDEEGLPIIDEDDEEETAAALQIPVGAGGGVEHFTNLTISKNKKSRGVKALVSKKKRRFVQDGFDLDLTYITDQIVAMGFPAEGAEALYRNALTDVYRFFETRHKSHYKIYNLCSERAYDSNKFNGMVECFPFDDHNAPPFEMMFDFCENVSEWLGKSTRNVAAIHCKAGKGRTGVMICAYLLHSRAWKSANEAMSYYGMVRTHDLKGVTISSQKRYIHYYAEVLETGPKVAQCLRLQKFRIRTIPYGKCKPWIKIENGSKTIKYMQLRNEDLKEYSTKNTPSGLIDLDCKAASGDMEDGVPLVGDVRITGYHKKGIGGDEKMFQFWFHTAFVKDGHLIIMKGDLDKACKDKKHKDFEKTFGVEMFFEKVDDWVDNETHMPGSGIISPQVASRSRGGSRHLVMNKSDEQVAKAAAAKTATLQSAMSALKATQSNDGRVSVKAVRKASLMDPSSVGRAVQTNPEEQPKAVEKKTVQTQVSSQSSASSKSSHKHASSEDDDDDISAPGLRMTAPTLVRAIYNYDPQEKNHLMLRKDDVVTVIQKTDSGWSLGKCGANIGWFPQRYVVVLDTNVKK
mmetsp:Transcript_42963/g.110972  ORF Transcript_42963/g.110972 Transcript_42963/m.110972 type:complete len:725 (-) Transcript_42963:407-2581(-)|eukprot:CAMPEP_0113893880 /NCGR_PEP_ID=MMETSP0780_2-20120614/16361_1 /TAXON_ID=652834 /ORGANISM="Palpitomonas bilix" /LENGTH=724 /DNA_ID=CAMNT_0000884265 /DNA_START=126 /DNA_END=2300 /DNA_ORIENTATION=- /assembly_acc=CAM_ASM_000599